MKRSIAVAGILVAGIAGPSFGSGYRIPEQSVNSTALSGAYTAHTQGADTSYFNPANMPWQKDQGLLETDMLGISLSSVHYDDNRTPGYDGDSEEENFLMPTFFAVSPDYNHLRVGVSLVYPAGLAKRWQDPYPRTFAEEFSLQVVELNPSVAYRISDAFSVAGGVRAVYAEATVRSRGLISQDMGGVQATRDMDGDTTGYGYNLAATIRPADDLNLSITYRSIIRLDFDGDASLWTSASAAGASRYEGTGSVYVPVPPVLTLAGSYTFFDRLTLELEYDRTYWSEYRQLDFNYPVSLNNPYLTAAFDDPKAKDWRDTDAWRVGVTYQLNEMFTLLAGFGVDENPVPDETLGFDLPDSDGRLYSAGLRWRLNKAMELGFAYLYDDKEERTVANSIVNGTFKDAAAHQFVARFSYDI